MVAVPVVTSVIGIGQTYLANLVGLKVMQDLRNALYTHLQHMPLRFFTKTRTGRDPVAPVERRRWRAVGRDRHGLERAVERRDDRRAR